MQPKLQLLSTHKFSW